jgi:hypothetical protein
MNRFIYLPHQIILSMLKKRLRVLVKILPLAVLSVACVESAAAFSIIQNGTQIAGVLAVISIMVSLPAFVSLYIHIRKTNLGKLLLQPLIAMFIGFFGIMLNSIIDLWRIFNGVEVDNRTLITGINSSISSIIIAVGAIIMFFSVKKHGLFEISYYQKKKEEPQKPKTLEIPAPPKASAAAETQEKKPEPEKKRDSIFSRLYGTGGAEDTAKEPAKETKPAASENPAVKPAVEASAPIKAEAAAEKPASDAKATAETKDKEAQNAVSEEEESLEDAPKYEEGEKAEKSRPAAKSKAVKGKPAEKSKPAAKRKPVAKSKPAAKDKPASVKPAKAAAKKAGKGKKK